MCCGPVFFTLTMIHPSELLEKTVEIFFAAVHGSPEVVCGPVDGFGMFGWKIEAGDLPYPSAMQGDREYGEAYLRHMIGQGFSVGFAVWRQPHRALVCLKTWEPGDDEPSWPMDTSIAQVVYHGR